MMPSSALVERIRRGNSCPMRQVLRWPTRHSDMVMP